MPKLSPDRLPSYSHHKASGQAVVLLNGESFYLGKHGTAASRRKYDRMIGEWQASGRHLPAPEGELTVKEVILRFWQHAKSYYAGSGELENYRPVLRGLKRLYGDTPAADFGPLALKALRNDWLKPRKEIDPKTKETLERPGWCRNIVNRQTGRAKAVFKWAVSEQLIPADVHHGLLAVDGLRRGRCEARESDPVRPVPETNVLLTLPHLSRQLQAVVKLQLLTGARGGELLIMRPIDIDTTGKVWAYKPQHHKTEHHDIVREIRLGPKAQEIIAPFLGRPTDAYLFSASEAKADWLAARHAKRKTPPSCGNKPGSNVKRKPKRSPGDYYDSRAYAHAVRHACRKAGVPHWHPHQLRHTAASKFRREYGIEVARILLGHTGADTTAIYAEADMRQADKVMGEVG